MITEFQVLNTLAGGGWLTVDEVSTSPEWDDRWAAKKTLEMLTNAGLLESLHSNDSAEIYHITLAGEYRLQQLKELSYRQEAENRENRIWQLIGITIGLLTLGATVLFGILTLRH